jgi:DHA1 family bicyclomycin/chloramphenicol resistance-like MFS transporter
MEFFHVSGKTYGWIFAFLSIGFVGSSQLNSVLLRYFRSERIVIVALSWQAIIAIIFLAGSYYNWFGLYGTLAMIFLILCGVGITNPNASALSLAPFSKNAGTASSLMGTMQLGIGALSSFSVSLFKVTSTLPLAGIMMGSTVIALIVLMIGRRKIVEEVEVDKDATFIAH